MNSKEEIIKGLFLTFEKFGEVSYKKIWSIANIYQNDIKKFFGTLKNACEQLNISTEKNNLKIIKCSKCNKDFKIPKFTSNNYKHFCDICKKNEKIIIYNQKFEGLKEDFDYLVCPKCGFKTRSLEAHFRESNKTWTACKFSKEEVEKEFGKFIRIRAPILDIKAKTKRRENGWYKNPLKTKEEMSKSAGKHLLGKTKENCEYVKKMSETKKKNFISGKYDNRKFKITKEQIQSTALEDNTINVYLTSEKLKVPVYIVNRLCKKNRLEISRKWTRQTFILKIISEILDENFIEEFQFPKSRFRFDGCFEKSKLLVEVNGYQHYIFPNFYHRTRELFQKNQERDQLKILLAKDQGYKLIIISYKDKITKEDLTLRIKNIF